MGRNKKKGFPRLEDDFRGREGWKRKIGRQKNHERSNAKKPRGFKCKNHRASNSQKPQGF